jgi:DNA-binding NarL/FixJ family response regulator
MKPLRVVIADDHALLRAGLRALLAQLEAVEVVGEAGDGHEVLRLVAERNPEVLLLDIGLPGLNGLEVADRLAAEQPQVRVVILSMHGSEEYVLRALQAKVAGYLMKGATVAELELALRTAAAGETYLSPSISRHVISDYLNRSGAPAPSPLTPRQREILQLVAEGLSTKEIASRLSLSAKTVDSHRAQLMERLGINDVAGLVRYAIRTGLTSLDR